MSKTVVLIGGDGVGKSTLVRALMQLSLNHTVVTVEQNRRMHVDGDVSFSVGISLPECFKEPAEIGQISRRNKSDRKRNRADRWR